MRRKYSVAYNLKIETKGQRMFTSYIIAPYFLYTVFQQTAFS